MRTTMKYYKDEITSEIYAYALDGSQDEWIKKGLIQINDDELKVLLKEISDKARLELELTQTPNVSIDPAKKLAEFLALNPDVVALISQ
jgi:Fe-S cluster biosynthesis and repair protein YggX